MAKGKEVTTKGLFKRKQKPKWLARLEKRWEEEKIEWMPREKKRQARLKKEDEERRIRIGRF
jgi:hypothetical protein